MQNHHLLQLLRFFALMLFALVNGCNRADADHLGKITGIVGKRINPFLPTKTPFDPLLSSSNSHDLVSRIKTRFTLDRLLSPLQIEIVQENDKIYLRGQVKDESLRLRAKDIAETTEGTEPPTEIINQLTE